MNRHQWIKQQRKGLMISVLFALAIALIGFDLGRVLWILLVLFLIIAFALYALRIALRDIRKDL